MHRRSQLRRWKMRVRSVRLHADRGDRMFGIVARRADERTNLRVWRIAGTSWCLAVSAVLMVVCSASCSGGQDRHIDGTAPSDTLSDGFGLQCDGGPPGGLVCGRDPCGGVAEPICPIGRWVCPVIQSSPSCSFDAGAGPSGVRCGSGVCPVGMVCELQSESPSTWACTPFPTSCPTDAEAIVTCSCINQEEQKGRICGKGGSPVCEPTDGGFVIGCIVVGATGSDASP